MATKEYKVNGISFIRVNVSAYDNQGRRYQMRREGIKTLSEAKRIERELQRECQAHALRREQEGCSWKQLIDDYAADLYAGRASDRPIQRTTIEDTLAVLERYTDPWMSRPASSISVADVKDALRWMENDGKSRSRQKALKSAINGIFTWAIENRKVMGMTMSPTQGVKLTVPKEERRPEVLNLAHINHLLNSAKAYQNAWYPVWAMALFTGMRSGELFALEWPDVNFEERRIHVTKSWNARLKCIKSTKSSYWRDVPINPELERLLRELRATSAGRTQVLPRLVGWNRGDAARILRSFCIGIGIPSVKFHALRACFATHLLRSGTAPAVVMKICGWTELKTMQHYIRLAGIEIDGATDALPITLPEDAANKVVELFSQGGTTA